MTKTLVIELGGGLGNRMKNLINGFYFRDKYNFTKTYVTWRYQWGWMAYYRDILSPSSNYELIDESELGYPPCFGSGIVYPPGLREQDFKVFSPTDPGFREESLKELSSVVLRDSSVYSKIPLKDCYKIVQNYFPSPSAQLIKKIDAFMDSSGLETDKFLGVHIRRTDKLGRGPEDNYYISEIKKFLEKEGSKVFLCSDDPATENKIKNMFPQSVFVREKPPNSNAVPLIGEFKNSDFNKNQVRFSKEINDRLEQIIPRADSKLPEWWINERDPETGIAGMIYNIYRSRLHVLEAVTDFFILSKSSRILNSLGTFYDMANCISESRKS